MAYKPTTGTSILDNDFRLATSEGVYEALQLKQDALPAYSDDKVLYSTASAPEWRTVGTGSTSAAYPANTVILGRSKPASLTGAANTIIGDGAANAITSGNNNVAIGYESLSAATANGYSVAVGPRALKLFNDPANTWKVNVALGAEALENTTTGWGHLAIGYRTLRNSITGQQCVAIGGTAGENATNAQNTFIGANSGRGVLNSSTGFGNTAIGFNSLTAFTSGNKNIVLGYNSGNAITTGSDNVIIGSVTGSATLASTMIFAANTAERFRVDSSGNMGIGTSSPTQKLDVSGNVKANSAILNGATSGNITLSAADTTTSYSVKMPAAQGSADMLMHNDGSGNLSWNYAGLGSGSYPGEVVILGRDKPAGMTGTSSTIIGVGAGNALTSGISNHFIGPFAGSFVTTQQYNIFFGSQAGRYSTGNSNVFMGHAAGRGAATGFSGNNNIGIGHQALLNATTGQNNVSIGFIATQFLTTAQNVVAIGSNAGRRITTTSNVSYIGTFAGENVTGAGNVAIGTSAMRGVLDASPTNNNVALGTNALTAITTGGGNVAIGSNASLSLTTASNTCTIGGGAGQFQNIGNFFAFGSSAGLYQTGFGTMALGTQALQGVNGQSTGTHNVAVGMQAGLALTTGGINLLVGNFAGNAITTGSRNIFFGYNSGRQVTTGGNNTIIGDDQGSATLSDTVIVRAGTAERFRVDSAGNMGIGTSTPGEKLEVAGAVLATEYRVPNYRLDPHTHDEGTETGNFTINWANGAVHTVTLNAAGPLVVTMNNPVNGGAYALRIIQGATPGTVTWPANVKWPGGTPPTLSSSTGDIDIVNFLYFDDGGGNTFYYGTIAQDFA